MKITRYPYLGAAVLAGLFATASLASAQDGTTTTTTSSTTSAGTVSDFGPDVITVKSTTSPSPISYSYSKTTTYVDQFGNPVSVETVKSGMPVTVYYTQDGDRMVASKVVVRRTTTSSDEVPAPSVEETRKTSTTTTTTGGQ
ncbi:MAG: hypothetical protein LV479_00915 [Methylacidiphilales bacterium]|nr:hypothetical protein [Candidatus Methylacidiphilales bacterium]